MKEKKSDDKFEYGQLYYGTKKKNVLNFVGDLSWFANGWNINAHKDGKYSLSTDLATLALSNVTFYSAVLLCYTNINLFWE